MPIELVSFTDIKNLIGLEDASISDYPGLQVILNRLLHSFQTELGREFERVERTETHFINATPTRMIPLKGLPVQSVSQIEVFEENISGSTLLGSTYHTTEYGIRLFDAYRNTRVVVTYTGGLADISEEPAINSAAIYQLAYEFDQKDQIGAESFTSEGGRVDRPPLGLLAETVRMLQSSYHPLKL